MSDFAVVTGFEDVWRPPARPRPLRAETVLPGRTSGEADVRARLSRIANRAPEVMVKVTGRTRDGDHLRAHLDYISRRGALEMEGAEGERVSGRSAVQELADNWCAEAAMDRRRRVDRPISLSLVLSMPAGTDAGGVRDAGHAFAAAEFGGRFDYVMALHTDAGHPHVHIAACSRGFNGERLNPKKADLERWRQRFAEALRDHGIEAEATPRRARGVSRRPERMPLRKMTDRFAAGSGEIPRTVRAAYHEAGRAALGSSTCRAAWEERLVERQRRVRGLYLAQARLLKRSPDTQDRTLGRKVEDFVRGLPQPDTRRLALARELRAAGLGPSRQPTSTEKDRRR